MITSARFVPLVAVVLAAAICGTAAAQAAKKSLALSVNPTKLDAGISQPRKLVFQVKNESGQALTGLTSSNLQIQLTIKDLGSKQNLGNLRAGDITSEWNFVQNEINPAKWTLAPQAGRQVDWAAGDVIQFKLEQIVDPPAGTASFSFKLLGSETALSLMPTNLTVKINKPSVVVNLTARPSLIAAGAETTLTWHVDDLSDGAAGPQKVEICSPPKQNCKQATPPFVATFVATPNTTTKYEVTATPLGASAKRTVTAQRTVTVQQSAGWYSLASPRDPSGKSFLPTALFSEDQPGTRALYGIFVNPSDGKASFWRSPDPANVPSWFELREAKLPAGAETASAAYLAPYFYLVGGSTALNGAASQKVWRYHPGASDNEQWQAVTPSGASQPQARSGQSVVVYKNAIWMIGGYDRWSNALADVWSFDGTSWTEQAKPTWSGRGLAAVAAFDDQKQLLAVGGFSGYQQKPLLDAWVYNGTAWTSQTSGTVTGLLDKRLAGLVLSPAPGDSSDLYLSSTRLINTDDVTVESNTWRLTNSGGWQASKVAANSAWVLAKPYFSLTMTPFAGCLWLTALATEDSWSQKLFGNPAMYYFVPPPPQDSPMLLKP